MNPIKLEDIDHNLRIPATVTEPDIVWHDARSAPFAIYGLYNVSNPPFRRMPDEVAQAVSENVAKLAHNTAGGRIRFATDSDVVAIHALMPGITHFPHMALSGSAGFDLYIDDPQTETSRFWLPFLPPKDVQDGYESLIRFPCKKLRFITVHLPLYSNVDTLMIGIRNDAVLREGMAYRNDRPVVYYGSSVTQGGCASRPGNSYQSIIARRMNLDYINLGFSGSGKAEDEMIAYLASLPMCAFVSDYDHNAPNVEHLQKTHCKLYKAIRAAHPDIPYLMLSRSEIERCYDENILRRNVVMDTYRYARENGDRNVYYIDGMSVFRGIDEDICTVDGTHPNDCGFAKYADVIGAELKRALTQSTVY